MNSTTTNTAKSIAAAFSTRQPIKLSAMTIKELSAVLSAIKSESK